MNHNNEARNSKRESSIRKNRKQKSEQLKFRIESKRDLKFIKFVGRDETRAPLKTPSWEGRLMGKLKEDLEMDCISGF